MQKGQDLVIACPVECAWFARLCAGAAYDAGCREVIMNWRDDALTRMKYLRAADQVFDAMKEVGDKMAKELKETGEGGLAGTAAGREIAAKILGK